MCLLHFFLFCFVYYALLDMSFFLSSWLSTLVIIVQSVNELDSLIIFLLLSHPCDRIKFSNYRFSLFCFISLAYSRKNFQRLINRESMTQDKTTTSSRLWRHFPSRGVIESVTSFPKPWRHRIRDVTLPNCDATTLAKSWRHGHVTLWYMIG